MMVVPIPWNRHWHAERCCGCGEPFKPGDKVYPSKMTGAVNVHYREECAKQYNDDRLDVEKGK